MKQLEKKPELGAVLIAAFYALSGIFFILSALMIKGIDPITCPEIAALTCIEATTLTTYGTVALIIMGIVSFILSYGIWTTTPWAWVIVMIISLFGVIFSLFASSIIGLLIPVVIIWYLWTNKTDFGIGDCKDMKCPYT